MSSIVSLTKQQIAVYKMAQKPTPQNKVLENVRLEVVEQSDGMMGGVVIHVGKHDEPILIKSSPDYAWDGNEIVTGVAPIKSDDA